MLRGFGWALLLSVGIWALAFCAYKTFAEPEIAHAQAYFQQVGAALASQHRR